MHAPRIRGRRYAPVSSSSFPITAQRTHSRAPGASSVRAASIAQHGKPPASCAVRDRSGRAREPPGLGAFRDGRIRIRQATALQRAEPPEEIAPVRAQARIDAERRPQSLSSFASLRRVAPHAARVEEATSARTRGSASRPPIVSAPLARARNSSSLRGPSNSSPYAPGMQRTRGLAVDESRLGPMSEELDAQLPVVVVDAIGEPACSSEEISAHEKRRHRDVVVQEKGLQGIARPVEPAHRLGRHAPVLPGRTPVSIEHLDASVDESEALAREHHGHSPLDAVLGEHVVGRQGSDIVTASLRVGGIHRPE